MATFVAVLCFAPTLLQGDGGVFGAFPMHGGNPMKQQIAMNSNIDRANIHNLDKLCTFSNDGSWGYIGYPIVDDSENVYFSDNHAVKSVDIATCTLNWEVTYAELNARFGAVDILASLNTPVLIETDAGVKAVMFGLHASSPISDGGMWTRGCGLAAFHVENGTILSWINIQDPGDIESSYCFIHGVIVDGQYAYGGVSSPTYVYDMDRTTFTDDGPMLWRGKAFKYDINTGEIVAEWHSLPEFDYDTLETELFYGGASIYPHMSVIGNYFVFGTANMHNIPMRVQECLLNENITIENANVYDICGNDRSDNDLYRCLEDGVYANSIIVLNKHTFDKVMALPTQGVGTYHSYCRGYASALWQMNSTTQDKYWWDNDYCPKYNIIPEYVQNFSTHHMNMSVDTTPGMNGDVSSVATYYHDGIPYAIIGNKMGYFWIIDLNEMKVKLSKKVSPWGMMGGSSPFSMAVDQQHMIAIYTARGPLTGSWPYKYQIPDGNIGCGTGMVYAIDLLSGRTIWQWVHPFMRLNDECFDDCLGDGVTDCMDYEHFDWDWGQCEMPLEGQDSFNETNITVIYPPKNDSGLVWMSEDRRGTMIGPSTINGDLVFIPTMTGEIYVHSVVDGEYIRTIYCPQYQWEYEDHNGTQYRPNREGTRSGQTMFGDYLLFYCGSSFTHPSDANSHDNELQMGALVVMKLNSDATPCPTASEWGMEGYKTWMIVAAVFIVLFVIMAIWVLVLMCRKPGKSGYMVQMDEVEAN